MIDPHTILDVGGERIGIIGLTTPETEILASPSDELVFNYDLIGVTQDQVDQLTMEGVNKIILVTHIGYGADVAVAQGVSGVDVVVGGHTNTFLSNAYAGALRRIPDRAGERQRRAGAGRAGQHEDGLPRPAGY